MAFVKELAESRKVGEVQSLMKDTITLVNNRRAKFIDKNLVPPVRDVNDIASIVNRTKKEKADQEEAKHKKKRFSRSIFAGQESLEKAVYRNEAEEADKAAEDAKLASIQNRTRLLASLRRKEVTYGKGRLRSTHNLKGPIEYPYEFISDSYQPDMI